MVRMFHHCKMLLLVLTGAAALGGPGRATAAATGLVYLGQNNEAALSRSGLNESDMLTTVQRSTGHQPLENPWQLEWSWLTEGARGDLVIGGLRNGLAQRWTLADGSWSDALLPASIKTGPDADALRFMQQQRWTDASAVFERGRGQLAELDGANRGWLNFHHATALALAGDTQAAVALARLAADEVRLAAGDSPWLHLVDLRLAEVLSHAGETVQAAELLQSVVDQGEQMPALVSARIYGQLGEARLALEQFNPALAAFNQAAGLTARQAPQGYRAGALEYLIARAQFANGALDQADQAADRGLAIFGSGAGAPKQQASLWTLKGRVAQWRGQMDQAWLAYEAADTIAVEGALPTSDRAAIWLNMGAVAKLRGDLALADDLYQQTLDHFEADNPGVRTHGIVLINMANVAMQRRELARAEDLYLRALGILEHINARSMDTALALMNLGVLAANNGRMDEALDYYRLSFEIRNERAPNSLQTAQSVANVGAALSDLDRLEEADAAYGQAIEIMQQAAPGGLRMAATLFSRAYLAHKLGDYERSLALAKQALAIRLERIPEAAATAETQARIARTYDAMGDLDQAINYACAAADTLDLQKQRLGGTQSSQASFSRHYARFYGDCMRRLVDAGRDKQAFAYSEQYRAYFLLRMLAERPLLEAAGEQSMAYSKMADQYAALTRQRAGLDADRGDELHQISRRIDELDTQMAVARQRIKERNPKLVRLTGADPATDNNVVRSLPQSTLLLSYVVTDDALLLFATRAGQKITAYKIEISADRLSEMVSQVSQALVAADDGFAPMGRDLGKLLLGPVQSQLQASEDVLIITDSSLNLLPFAALVTSGEVEPMRYLVQDHSVRYAVSATMHSWLARKAPPQSANLLAFGDPLYPKRMDEMEIAVTRTRSVGLLRLPESRREVESISALYPDQSRVFLDASATEKNLRDQIGSARMVHLAAHGIFDSRFPLESALALSAGNGDDSQDDGFLRTWEIFQQVQLDAELVTLSACETAVGLDGAGEGLVGLQQAFHYAGARAVLASAWPVADRPTTDLMVALYRHHLAGRNWAQSLRLAQLAMIDANSLAESSPSRGVGGLTASQLDQNRSHPYYWAAWRLNGPG